MTVYVALYRSSRKVVTIMFDIFQEEQIRIGKELGTVDVAIYSYPGMHYRIMYLIRECLLLGMNMTSVTEETTFEEVCALYKKQMEKDGIDASKMDARLNLMFELLEYHNGRLVNIKTSSYTAKGRNYLEMERERERLMEESGIMSKPVMVHCNRRSHVNQGKEE